MLEPPCGADQGSTTLRIIPAGAQGWNASSHVAPDFDGKDGKDRGESLRTPAADDYPFGPPGAVPG